MGYNLVLFPVLSTLAAITGVYDHLRAFKQDGLDAVRDLDDAFEACPIGDLHEFSGFPQIVEWERQYLPAEEQDKYDRSLGDSVSSESE